jgi:hypothetical protein
VFESLYLVSYSEEDKYVGGSPKLLKCFSGIEGGVNTPLLLLLVLKTAVSKVARKIKLYITIYTPILYSDAE